MLSLFDYLNYREYIRDRLKLMPKDGYGQSRRLAEYLSVHTSLVSQVMQGSRTFNLEQSVLVAEFLGLSSRETDFFLVLVQLDRAGNELLRKTLRRQLEKYAQEASELANRLNAEMKLSDEQRAVFYSHWAYSAVRQMTAIEGFYNAKAISDRLKLSPNRVLEILSFLVEAGLCVKEGEVYRVGPRSTHLPASAPWVRPHHMNWRQKAMENTDDGSNINLHYTCPMTISRDDIQKIRNLIITFLEDLDPIIEPSASEELVCLNIDWFRV